MTGYFRINIPRPYPGTHDNQLLISFIEPLRVQGRVIVSLAYMFNLEQYNIGREPSLSPGYRYEFTFPDSVDATAFKLKFGGEEVK